LNRLENLENWLNRQFPDTPYRYAPASADASFRRYFRVTLPECSHIVMDAPPAHEDCRPFIQVAGLLREAGVNAPEVLAQDLDQGFLLLTDLGDTTYLAALNEDNADALYRDAIDALVKFQLASRPGVLPPYDETLLLREMRLFPDWYVSKHLQAELSGEEAAALEGVFAQLNRNILAQGQVYVHRDYHSRNLMVSDANPGVLDFQDAVHGAASYDLVSLFKDAYIDWEEKRVLDWAIRYWEKAKKAGLPVDHDFGVFYRDFEWMGAQRHIKVLGIFARLYHRDGKDGYLKDMPLVNTYLRKTCERYAELHPLLHLLDRLEERQAEVGFTF
jgi:N-acetylmuramate 1-kinase